MWDVGLVLCHERYHTEIKPDRRYGTQIFSRRQRNKEEGKKTVDRQTDRDRETDKAGEGLAGVAEPAGSLGPFLGVCPLRPWEAK